MLNFDLAVKSTLNVNESIKSAFSSLNISGSKIILAVDEYGKFVGTLCDGDIRRALLSGANLDSEINQFVNKNAIVCSKEMPVEYVKDFMKLNSIQHLPVVCNETKEILGLYLWDSFDNTSVVPNLMVIMAGGQGKRLRPHTESCPKPMLEVGGKPLLEHIITKAKLDGIVNFVISVNYLSHMIKDYFGLGEKLGVSIEYLEEDVPLGTAGAIHNLKNITAPILVTNGDVLTDFSSKEVLEFHNFHNSLATMAVKSYEMQNPFGVVNLDGLSITGFDEKPIYHSKINAGIYVLSPEAISYIPSDKYFDMPSLFMAARQDGQKIVAFPIHEPWLDIGRPDDLKIAQKSVSS